MFLKIGYWISLEKSNKIFSIKSSDHLKKDLLAWHKLWKGKMWSNQTEFFDVLAKQIEKDVIKYLEKNEKK